MIALTIGFLVGACADESPTALAPAVRTAPQSAQAASEQGLSRRATPWNSMSRAELKAQIEAAGGLVFIGFKDPSATAGVDEKGRSLVSRGKSAEAKGRVRNLDAAMEIQYESADLPMVVARINPARLQSILNDPSVEYVEPVFTGTLHSQNIPWNVARINAPAVWPTSTGTGAKILIADTGVPASHPDIATPHVSACDGSNGIDTHGHGTMVTSVASAANNTVLGVGAAYGAELWSVKIGNANPLVSAVVCAVDFGRINDMDVINLTISSAPYTALTDAINAAVSAGVVVVAAAGNAYGGPVHYPARLPNVIAVGGTGINNELSDFNAVGPEVFIVAPGFVIDASCLNGSQCLASGTSVAAPHVSAAVAILRSIDPTLSVEAIRTKLKMGATDLGNLGPDPWFGNGLLNVAASVAYQPPPPPPPPPPPFTVTIVGNEQIAAQAGCVWSAIVEGGTPPYTYTWKLGKTPIGSGENFWYVNTGSDFTLRVDVTDAAQNTTAALLPVAINPYYFCS